MLTMHENQGIHRGRRGIVVGRQRAVLNGIEQRD
jgi:hypothetical protein